MFYILKPDVDIIQDLNVMGKDEVRQNGRMKNELDWTI